MCGERSVVGYIPVHHHVDRCPEKVREGWCVHGTQNISMFLDMILLCDDACMRRHQHTAEDRQGIADPHTSTSFCGVTPDWTSIYDMPD